MVVLLDYSSCLRDLESMSDCQNCAGHSRIFPPDPASIRLITERIDALAEKVSEERAERLEMRHVVSQTHMLVKSIGLSRLLASAEEANVLDCDQSCKLEHKVVSPLQKQDDQDLWARVAKLRTAMDAMAERVSSLAENCHALAAGQVLNYQAAQEMSDSCKQDIDKITQRMSAFGHEISKAVQEVNVEQMCSVSRDMTALNQELITRLGRLETDVRELRALRDIDLEHADETDRWLVRHHELIQKQSDRFSVTIDALLQSQTGKSSASYVDAADIRVGSLKARLQKCTGTRTAHLGSDPKKHSENPSGIPHVVGAQHFFIGDDEAASATPPSPRRIQAGPPNSSWAIPPSSSRMHRCVKFVEASSTDRMCRQMLRNDADAQADSHNPSDHLVDLRETE